MNDHLACSYAVASDRHSGCHKAATAVVRLDRTGAWLLVCEGHAAPYEVRTALTEVELVPPPPLPQFVTIRLKEEEF